MAIVFGINLVVQEVASFIDFVWIISFSPQIKALWLVVVFTNFWDILLPRNKTIFEDKVYSSGSIIVKIKIL